MKNYILIDMSNIEHRCKHIQAYDVDIKAGMALQIALNSFRQMWRKFNGNHLVVCLEGRSWRKDIYPDYKAHRQSLLAHRTKKEIEDDEFYFTTMREFTKFLADKTNVTVLQSNIGEADDLIARWIFLHPEDKHIVCSGDTDFYQLLSDNVTIYDAVKNWTISSTEVLNEDDKPAVSKKNVKIKDIKSGKQISKLVETRIAPPVAEYELFKKIIRGDASDNIMSAYPGAREHGSLKKPGIKEAFDDRIDKGYEWNQFMLHEWNKLIGVDAEDNVITKKVRVVDEFKINKLLIDLTEQPASIKECLDDAIVQAVQKPIKQGVGIWFLRFTEEMGLTNIGKNPTEYAQILSTPYIPLNSTKE